MMAAAERAATAASAEVVEFVLQSCLHAESASLGLYEKYLRGIRLPMPAACETFELGAPMAAISIPNNESYLFNPS